MKKPLIIIGGGLSGLAAAIRFARYSPEVLILEKHNKIGGLNSYYYRNRVLLETGLHAITNYAPADKKRAPLNRLFRQLKLSRKNFKTHSQLSSEIIFGDSNSLVFSNNFDDIREDVHLKFSHSSKGFDSLVEEINAYDPFVSRPFQSAKKFVFKHLQDTLLTDMLLCPLMYYGSSVENDLDLGQFVIMFRSIYQEGMFRPAGTIKDFLDMLLMHYKELGGSMRLSTKVERILNKNDQVYGVELKGGEVIEADYIISTAGVEETYKLLGKNKTVTSGKRLGFVESIYLLEGEDNFPKKQDKTILFYNTSDTFNYSQPTKPVDLNSGVICFPGHFQDRPAQPHAEIRSTHLANYSMWSELSEDSVKYQQAKEDVAKASRIILERFVGEFKNNIVYKDTFTPITIKKYTAKIGGAIYGSPEKFKDGLIGYTNLFIAGTDQGFLGIIGSMLSGVSMINRHILPKL